MGTSPEIMEGLKRTILQDRNHPCVFAWSLGNEEWGLEGNEKGAQIAAPMQDFVKRLDPTRYVSRPPPRRLGQRHFDGHRADGVQLPRPWDTDD